ncbi:MAG: hypothetical protein J6Y30_09410 [Treponema sp.]|nr:hypothetical protein [Treponema sp.]
MKNGESVSVRKSTRPLLLMLSLFIFLSSIFAQKKEAFFADCGRVWDLAKFNIVSEEDLKREGGLSVEEALRTLLRAHGSGPTWQSAKEWYLIKELAPLDKKFSEEEKSFLVSLFYAVKRPLLTREELFSLSLNAPLTEYGALKYVTRFIGNTYSCIDEPEEIGFTEQGQTYGRAFDRKLILSKSEENASKPILRKDFYFLLASAMNTNVSFGGYSTVEATYFSFYENAAKSTRKKKEKIVHEGKLYAKPKFNDDFSLSLNVKRPLLGADKYFTQITSYTADGRKLASETMCGIRTSYSCKNMVMLIINSGKERKIEYASYLVLTISRYNSDWSESWEETARFDLSDVKIVQDLKMMNPGTLKTFDGQWVPKTISLKSGLFKKDAFYLLHSYEHRYRKDEFNGDSFALFTVADDTSEFKNSKHESLFCGGLDTEDTHILEVMIDGDAKNGFVLHVSPESKEAFVEK